MLKEHVRRVQWEEYTATVLWSIGRITGGENYPIPSYSDLMYPELQDTRTGQEIVDGLIAKLVPTNEGKEGRNDGA